MQFWVGPVPLICIFSADGVKVTTFEKTFKDAFLDRFGESDSFEERQRVQYY